MFRIVRALAIVVVTSVVSSQNGASQDLPRTAPTQHGGGGVVNVPADADGLEVTNNTARAVSGPGASEEVLSLRRSAYYYSWRAGCYTQDRNQNWYQVDPRLC
jgi:hypothetical protein